MFKSRRIFFLLCTLLLPCLLVQADLPNKLNDLKKGLHALQDKLGHLKVELAALKDVLVVGSGGSKVNAEKVEAIKKALQEIANLTSTSMTLRTQIGHTLQGLESSKPGYSDYEAALKSFDKDTSKKIKRRVAQLKDSYDWLKKPKKEADISVDLLVKTIDDTFAFFLKQSTDDMDEFRSHALNIFDKILTPESIFIMFDSIRLRDGIAFPIAMSTEAKKKLFFNNVLSSIINFEENPARYPNITTIDKLRHDIKNFKSTDLQVLINTLCNTGYTTAEEYFKSLTSEQVKKFIEDVTTVGSNLRKALFQAHAVRAALRNVVNPKENTLERTFFLIKSNPNALTIAAIFDKYAEQIFENLLIPEALFVDLDLINFKNTLFDTLIKKNEWEKFLSILKTSIETLEHDEHQKLANEKMRGDKGNKEFINREDRVIEKFQDSSSLKKIFNELRSDKQARKNLFNRHAARYNLRLQDSFYQIRLDEGVDLTSDIPPVLNDACWGNYIKSLDINNFNILYDNFHQKIAWMDVFRIPKLRIEKLLKDRSVSLKATIASFDEYKLNNPDDIKILRYYPDIIEKKISQVDNNTFEDICRRNESFNSFPGIKKERELRGEAKKLFRLLELSGAAASELQDIINKNKVLLSALSNHEYLRSEIRITNDKLLAIKDTNILQLYFNPQSTQAGEKKFIGKTIEEKFQNDIKTLIDTKTKPFMCKNILSDHTKFIGATELEDLAALIKNSGVDYAALKDKIKNIETDTANKLREAIFINEIKLLIIDQINKKIVKLTIFLLIEQHQRYQNSYKDACW